MDKLIYLDNSATTKISEEALLRYCEVSRAQFGNPSSLHARGKEAEDILRASRKSVMAAIGAREGTVLFTGSGTEANNLALFGRAHAKERYRRGRILTSAGEHASVSAPLAALAAEGYRIGEIPTACGALDLDALDALLSPDTLLVSVMAVNNETGAVYDIGELARRVRARCPDCALHVDATQALFKLPLDVKRLGVDLLTVSAHKVEGPKGVGALYVGADIKKKRGLAPYILGGGQEEGMRSGTENVPGIAAFATACEIGKENFTKNEQRMRSLRTYLLENLLADSVTAEARPLLPVTAAPHIVSLVLPRIKSEVMLHHLSQDGISVSSGSACSSHGKVGTSALGAFGLSDKEVDCTIRISLSHRNTEEEITLFLASLKRGLLRLVRQK